MSSKSFCFIEILSYTFLTSEFSGKNPKTRFQFREKSKAHFKNRFYRHEFSYFSTLQTLSSLPIWLKYLALPKPTQLKKCGLEFYPNHP
ncbi:hypothetical protein LEP1GSC043_4083 [Leptospira weilii str. Ecochallenge]|uniref:Uncharacterized protein n=2 Tax=Leptospira weilii TaxID=28184 RepID=N1UHS0_9LEPT|nr:hypothetical protein LEP1GSC038_2252 [Leptospira weilii str. 2006001855]EMY15570.1 hypothetical protein LEP1GSC043_4083 [Leptospira weilii str. Ecochallenge]